MIGKFLKVKRQKAKGKSLELNQSQIANRKSQIQAGFSLLELMIAMFILIILLSVAIPGYQRTILHARETVLKENLWQMRRAIDQYHGDKGKLPPSLSELVKDGYLREIPVDPMNELEPGAEPKWNEIPSDNTDASGDTEGGIKDVKSLAQGTDSDNKNYADY